MGEHVVLPDEMRRLDRDILARAVKKAAEHEKKPGAKAAAAPSGAAGVSREPGVGAADTRRDCYSWLHGNTCQYGKTCNFKHDPDKFGSDVNAGSSGYRGDEPRQSRTPRELGRGRSPVRSPARSRSCRGLRADDKRAGRGEDKRGYQKAGRRR